MGRRLRLGVHAQYDGCRQRGWSRYVGWQHAATTQACRGHMDPPTHLHARPPPASAALALLLVIIAHGNVTCGRGGREEMSRSMRAIQ